MNIKLKIVGDFTLPSIQAAIATVKNDLMVEVRKEISVRTPILTGTARRGWQQRNQAVVENTVPYIERLEKGYSRQAPNGFVNQGIRAAISTIEKKVKK
jgi:hypothetical protein